MCVNLHDGESLCYTQSSSGSETDRLRSASTISIHSDRQDIIEKEEIDIALAISLSLNNSSSDTANPSRSRPLLRQPQPSLHQAQPAAQHLQEKLQQQWLPSQQQQQPRQQNLAHPPQTLEEQRRHASLQTQHAQDAFHTTKALPDPVSHLFSCLNMFLHVARMLRWRLLFNVFLLNGHVFLF
jgi:hypothetical protein